MPVVRFNERRCEEVPLLSSEVEGGRNSDDGVKGEMIPDYTAIDISTPDQGPNGGSDAPEILTTTDRLISYADNVTEVLVDVVHDVAGEVQHIAVHLEQVVVDVTEDLQHAFEEIMVPEDHSTSEGESIHFAVARTLPSDNAQVRAVTAEPIFGQPYPAFIRTETVSITDIDTTEGPSAGSLGGIAQRDSSGSLSSKSYSNVAVEDPEDLIPKAETTEEEKTSGSTPLVAYLLLAAAVVGLSSIGPLLNVQNGVDGTIKTLWRNSATAVALLPFALRSIFAEGIPSLSIAQSLVLILTGACYAAYTVLFAWAVKYTTIGNAVIFGNTQAIILLIGKTIMGEPLSLMEGLGSVVAFIGAIFCSRDSAQGEDTSLAGSSLLGDGYALLCAFCGVGYLITAKAIRRTMNLYVFMCCVMFWSSVGSLVLAHLAGIEVTLDRHVDHGAFGWINWEFDRLPLELVMVLSCQFLGALGYIRCMHYFSTLVISVATLMEPVVAELTAVALGVGDLPGWMGWVGNLLVILGTLAVVYRPSSSDKGSHQ